MSNLDEVLQNSAVEIFESTAELDAEAFERRRQTVEARENRAVSGLVRDDRGRLLLARYKGDGRWNAWRLPGSKVGNVTDFEPRLGEHLTDLLGDNVSKIEPTQVQKHTARRESDTAESEDGNDREEPSLFYVLCDVELDGDPADVVDRASPGENVELEWFADKPDDVINEGVLSRLFGEE